MLNKYIFIIRTKIMINIYVPPVMSLSVIVCTLRRYKS